MAILFDDTRRVRGSLAVQPPRDAITRLCRTDLALGWARRATARRPGDTWHLLLIASGLLLVGGPLSVVAGPTPTGPHDPAYLLVVVGMGLLGLLATGLWRLHGIARHGQHLLRQQGTDALALLMGRLHAVLAMAPHVAGFVRAFPLTKDGFCVAYPVPQDNAEEDLLRLWLLPAVLHATTPRARPILPLYPSGTAQVADSWGNVYLEPQDNILKAADLPIPSSAHARLAAFAALRENVPARAHRDFDRWRDAFVARLQRPQAA